MSAWVWAIAVVALLGAGGGLLALVRLLTSTTRNPRHRR